MTQPFDRTGVVPGELEFYAERLRALQGYLKPVHQGVDAMPDIPGKGDEAMQLIDAFRQMRLVSREGVLAMAEYLGISAVHLLENAKTWNRLETLNTDLALGAFREVPPVR